VYFLVGGNGEVGCKFIGETEQRLPASKNDYRGICALHHNVGEIDPGSPSYTGITVRLAPEARSRSARSSSLPNIVTHVSFKELELQTCLLKLICSLRLIILGCFPWLEIYNE
jgi:hypothetical protein